MNAEVIDADEIKSGYRKVELPSGEWLLSGRLKLPVGDDNGAQKIRELMAKRNASQPVQSANAGSVFRNPPDDFAARLIDAAGLKGAVVGDAEISKTHANFIINRGDATANDIEELIAQVQTRSADEKRRGITTGSADYWEEVMMDTIPTRRRFPNAAISYIVLKHEGNMPFENDGLRGRMTGDATAERSVVEHTYSAALFFSRHSRTIYFVHAQRGYEIIAFGNLIQYGARCQRSPNRLPVATLRVDGQCRSRMTAKGRSLT